MADKRTYEQRKEYYRQWREKNKDKWNAYSRKDYETHKEERLEKNQEWRDNNPEFYEAWNKARVENGDHKCFWHKQGRRNHALINYGLTHEEFDALKPRLDNGPCEICGKVGKMMIDHNHTTNKFRGILCRHCNTMLGHAKDNVEVLKKAIEYLNHGV